MPTPTSQGTKQQKTERVLEEKLKVHIQREFDLGEKVISLLKQRKVLETHLQEQLNTKEELEHKLEEAVNSRQNLEQKYSQMQREMRAQQKALRQRSRRFVQTEEGSREDLKVLREEIHRLRDQLEILDIQKVEEHVRLSNQIESLCEQERQLKQELQITSYQKELAEEELDSTAENFQKMAASHEQEKLQHEQEIERLQRKQAQLEIQTAHILDEQQRNERTLQREIETLRLSKAELEEKVKQLKQQQPDSDQVEVHSEILQLIEEKEQAIRNVQEQAHQRSAMLRAENETLQQKVENILSSQEKISWENKMLESSLKSLQHDLAEYLLVKTKFEEARHEKEDFEHAFYQKIKFLEDRYMDAQQSQKDSHTPAKKVQSHQQEEQTERIVPSAPASPPAPPVKHTAPPSSKTPRQSRNNFWFTLLVPVAVLLLILIGVIIYIQVSPHTPENFSGDTATLPPVEVTLPEEFDMGFPADTEISIHVTEPLLPQEPVKQEPSGTESTPPQSRQPQPASVANSVAETLDTPASPSPKTPSQPTASTSPPTKPQPKRSVAIVVQLPGTNTSRFLPKEQQPFPTVDNNIVLRRRYERTH
jgi:hypothetical protein